MNKGEWDKGGTLETVNTFNLQWISLCREKLKDNGTIWVSGTYHNIFSVANAMQQQGFRILNVITWAKTNPPPNISCRFFTYSTEFVIWARKYKTKPHYYNYELMKLINGGETDDGCMALACHRPLGEVLREAPHAEAVKSVGSDNPCIDRT